MTHAQLTRGDRHFASDCPGELDVLGTAGGGRSPGPLNTVYRCRDCRHDLTTQRKGPGPELLVGDYHFEGPARPAADRTRSLYAGRA